MGAGDAELFGEVGDLFAPGIGADGAAIFSQGVGADGHFVLDGFIGMGRVIEVHGVLGGDDPMGRRNAAIGGADGQTPGAGRACESEAAAAGEALGQFIRIGRYSWGEFLPGFKD